MLNKVTIIRKEGECLLPIYFHIDYKNYMKCTFINGLKQGEYKIFFDENESYDEQGNEIEDYIPDESKLILREIGTFVDDKKHGISRQYSEEGKLVEYATYNNGDRIGYYFNDYFVDSELKEEVFYL